MARKILRFIALTIGLMVIGAVFGYIGALIGGRVLEDGSFAALGLALLGLFAGYFFGIVIGIVIINKLLHQPGSLFFGIIGGIIGAAIPWIISFSWNNNPTVFLYLPVVSVPALCLAGFYLKR